MSGPVSGRVHRRGVARALGGDRARRGPVLAPDHADDPAEYSPWWRHVIWPLLAALVATGGMLLGGVPAWRAVAIALAAGAALWAILVSLPLAAPEWPYQVPAEVTRTPTTWEVSGLIGARESEISFQQYLRPRLWTLAQELLRRRGIDPGSERAVELVGPAEYALLSGADTDPRHAMASVSMLCQVIARLAVQPERGSPPAIRNPALAGLAGQHPSGAHHHTATARPSEGPIR